VILDLTIPGGLGSKETAEQLLAIDSTVWLIVSSGYSNDPIMANYQAFGFSGAIAKPYTMGEFQVVLNCRPPRVCP
jgi:two-component system, cell cycle sensor histidine kinase and response regulator CckA